MRKMSMPMWYLLMLSVCIGQGDGRWKERDKENIQHDIMVYKKISEKLEREIEAFYDEYPNEWLKGDNVDRIHYKYLTNILNRNTETTQKREYPASENPIYIFNNKGADVSETTELISTDTSSVYSNKYKSTDWPAFEDILLDMGRKYDWKNDRWIKVKEKLKMKTSIDKMQSNTVSTHEQHKFSYKIVKLNKSKNRRNVVVAVSAVR